MAINLNILSITLDGTGTEIPTLNVSDYYEKYYIKGTAVASGNYAINPTGTPQQGTTFVFKYKANLTLGAFTFTLFGQSLTADQLLQNLDIECYYDGSAWLVEVKPSFTEAVVAAANMLASSVATASLQANAVTNAKMATMATDTFKGNVSGGTATPSDVTLNSSVWKLTGNSGTVAGTNFIGTTDAQNLVFKVGGVESGRLGKNASISFGEEALTALTTGLNNVALGDYALTSLTGENNNTAVGNSALAQCVSGGENAALGSNCLAGVTSGESNIGIGFDSGNTIRTGDNNICIGSGADVTSAGAANRIALGVNASASADNMFALPDSVTKFKWRGVTYTMPSANAAGVLTNDGSGNLTWA